MLAVLLALASGRSLAARGAAGQKAATRGATQKMPSRYMMWQTPEKTVQTQAQDAKKEVDKVPIGSRLVASLGRCVRSGDL